MILYLIGIDYRSAPISLREPIYRRRSEIVSFCRDTGEEISALFTCNRIELYGISENIFQAARSIKLFQERFPHVFELSYVKQGTEEVIEHALRLACGLESQIAGEEEITQQLNSWVSQDSFSWVSREIWNEILVRAEDIRIKSGLKGVKDNIAKIIFKDLEGQKKMVVIGTGKIARVFSENKPAGVSLYFAARKKHKRATRLARQAGAKAILLDDLPDAFLRADAVISATSSPHYVLKKGHFLDISKKRQRPLYVYDLAVPRDVEPDAGKVPGIFLQNLDDLDPVFKEHNKALDSHIKKAELLILHHIFEIAGKVREKSDAYSY